MRTIAETIAQVPGLPFDPDRYPYEYALDLALQHDVVPAEFLDAAHRAERAAQRPGVKRGPDRRAVIRKAIPRWCQADGAPLEHVYKLMADRYLELHSIDRATLTRSVS
ncbi:hypothetical protein LN042_35080 [Kitasatospora sp. RB6PN24]|uniref:hypothetical protein n=1 Tax=Kitasatospora humi TaxID=2893891 RepID=UPI001E2A3C90|nr:hypothetical protein [Kitasatospora humi]MCC9312227.1 hypothetical protein [Kitasatospora humi]